MKPILVDSHCHLQDRAFDGDREEVLARSLESLEFLVVIGDDMATSRGAAALCRDRVHAVVGLHPYHASDVTEESLSELRALCASPGVVGLGEIGLDYHNVYADPAVQREAFRRQLELAVELHRPVVIHNRDADDDSEALLTEFAPHLAGCVMHCFGSGAAFAERSVELGFYVSFAGNVTFPKAGALREAAAVVPLERLLVETDSPYLAPQPVRGRRCEPAYVRHTAECLAGVKGVAPEELARQTSRNARALFGLGDQA